MIQDFTNKNAAMVQRPKTLVCYICGREFGTQSLNIHIKSCMKKWENEQAKLPKNQRRPLPKPPSGYDEMAIKGQKGELNMNEVEQINKEAFKQYDQVSLIKCEYCNRTFLPERMDGHRKLCTAEKPFKPLGGGDKQKNQNSPDHQSLKASQTPQKQNQLTTPAKTSQPRAKSPAQAQKMSPQTTQHEEEKISPKKSNFGQQQQQQQSSQYQQQKQVQNNGSESGNYKEKYENLQKDYEILQIEFEAVKRENELLKKKMKA